VCAGVFILCSCFRRCVTVQVNCIKRVVLSHVHTHTRCMNIHTHICTQTQASTHLQARTHTLTHTRARTHTHTVHTHTHKYTHMLTHTLTRSHTHRLLCALKGLSGTAQAARVENVMTNFIDVVKSVESSQGKEEKIKTKKEDIYEGLTAADLNSKFLV